MSHRALEFVENWVGDKIEKMGDPPKADAAKVKALAAECVKAAQAEGVPQSEIDEAFDDLAAYIAGEIEAARERQTPSEDGMLLVEGDDARVIDEAEDDIEEDDKKS